MILLLDHINAMIIGATAFLIVMALQLRMNELTVEQVANYALKTQAADLAVWMEDDLLRMGTNVVDEVPFANPIDSAGVTTEFTFFWDSVNTAVVPFDTTRFTIRYKLVQSGLQVAGDDTLSTYRIARSQREGTGPWQPAGSSSAMISGFTVEMLNADAKPVSNPVFHEGAKPDSVRNTRLRFSMATPFQTARSTIRQVFYGSTLMIRQ